MTETKSSGLIQEGDMVVLKKDKHMQSVQVKSRRKYNLEKMWFCLDGAVNQPYGTTFETKGNLLVPVTREKEEDTDNVPDTDEASGRDNRNLVDKRANQKLSREEIESMRKEGRGGKVIVEQLIENSSTFKGKTEFAQQKYIKKKKKKHLNRVTVLRPSTRLLAEMYFNKGPTRICNLRMDSLAQILTYSNVRAGSRVLLVESCCGLLTGAIVERLGGHGMVMQLYSGTAPVWPAVNYYNFTEKVRSVLYKYPLKQLAQVCQKYHGSVPHTKSEEHPCKRIKSQEDGNGQCAAPVLTGVPSPVERMSLNADTEENIKMNSNCSDDRNVIVVEDQSPASPGDKSQPCQKEDPSTHDKSEHEVQMESELEVDKQQNLGHHSIDPVENKECPVNEQQLTSGSATESSCISAADNKSGENENKSGATVADQPEDENDSCDSRKQGTKRKLEVEDRDKEEERERKRQEKLNKIEESRQILEKGNFDGLILACRQHPTPILINSIGFLAKSRPFVIFSPYQQPLLDCYMKLRDKRGVANLRLTETWMRQYQVLPNRTHPHINMSNYSGYLLTGITTTSD